MCFNHINWSTSQTQQFHVHAKGLLAGVYRCIFAASVQVLHSHYSPILNKAIISPSHNTIFYFTHRFSRLFMASYQISPLPPFPPSLPLSFISPSVSEPLQPLPKSPVSLFALLPASLSFLSTLTLQRVFSPKSLITPSVFFPLHPFLLSFPPFLFHSLPAPFGGKSHTHHFAASVPNERACKENINEAPQPINT